MPRLRRDRPPPRDSPRHAILGRWEPRLRRPDGDAESDAALASVRTKASTLVRETTGDRNFSDTNHIIPTFILTRLPVGLVGLLIVAIIMAATDTIAGELNSLSTATVIDFYKRWVRRTRPTRTT